jgi:hypothetical protein
MGKKTLITVCRKYLKVRTDSKKGKTVFTPSLTVETPKDEDIFSRLKEEIKKR